MAREPEMQFFRESGTWHRPEGAVRVVVMIKGGDGGSGIDQEGNVVPGQEGQLAVKTMSADEVGATAQIKIGEAGRGAVRGRQKVPDGNIGYAVVVTYFE
jgi:hypothetical protein